MAALAADAWTWYHVAPAGKDHAGPVRQGRGGAALGDRRRIPRISIASGHEDREKQTFNPFAETYGVELGSRYGGQRQQRSGFGG